MSELISLEDPRAADAEVAGAKAARLARARRAGLPVLPGFVVPVTAASEPMRVGRTALATAGVARRAVSASARGHIEGTLRASLRDAVERLGGRVVVRSSSPLESDQRWAGAFSTLTEIGPGDVAVAVASCWASAFAPDPLDRLERCGLPPEALTLAVLLQPELRPISGGTARVVDGEVRVTGVRGHPGPLLAGWIDGFTATTGSSDADTAAAEQLGANTLAGVVELARAVHASLGDDMIEWASDPEIHLLQSSRSGAPRAVTNTAHRPGFADALDSSPHRPCHLLSPHHPYHLISATACVPGEAAGRLVYVRPHETVRAAEPHILVCDRPLPAFAPLVFGARAVVSVAGSVDAHLAEVARSIGVPMLVQAPLPSLTGPLETINSGAGWFGAVDGTRGELAVKPATRGP
jgi:phosphohistidine swiveling domain-containing protein